MNNDSTRAFAQFVLDNDDIGSNRHELLEMLEPLIAPEIFLNICMMLEICPMHYCADEICADDNILECAEYRN